MNKEQLKNPIKDNRIVNSKTFAIRLRDFISNVKVNDPCSEEEKEYLDKKYPNKLFFIKKSISLY